MARFVFRLESVLNQRAREEQCCQAALGEALGVQVDCEAKIAEIEQQVRLDNDLLRDRLIGAIEINELLRHRRFLATCALEVGRISERLVSARLKVEAARRKLTEAAKRRKALEILRDKQRNEFNSESERKEQLELDEAALQIAFSDFKPSAA